jgi:tRNA(Ile)-lysidine synthase
LHPAVQRRLLRHAAGAFGVSLGYDATESLRQLAIEGRAGQKLSLPGPLAAERTARELRLSCNVPDLDDSRTSEQHSLPVPGEAKAFDRHFRAVAANPAPAAIVRNWKAGDRVTLRYSNGPRKVKEVLERMKISGSARSLWPVVEWEGKIVWMDGVEVQPIPGITFSAQKCDSPAANPK